MTTFDEMCAVLNVTPAERKALVDRLADFRASVTRQKLAAPPAPGSFEQWWEDEGVKGVGLESTLSFARRCWDAGHRSANGVAPQAAAGCRHPGECEFLSASNCPRCAPGVKGTEHG